MLSNLMVGLIEAATQRAARRYRPINVAGQEKGLVLTVNIDVRYI